MRDSLKQQAFRRILSAILESDLGLNEMRELSRGFLSADYGQQLGHLLKLTVISLEDKRRENSGHTTDDVQVDYLFDQIQRRKMTKRSLLEFMRIVLGPRSAPIANSDNTIREIVEEFVNRASSKELNNFLELIGNNKGADPYLAGIVNRNRGQ